MKAFLRRHLTGALIFTAVVLVTLATVVVAQQQSLELIGVRPFIRMEGREAGAQTYEIRASAGRVSLANVSTATTVYPNGTLYAIGSNATGCTNAAVNETQLSYIIPANTLNANGKGIEVAAWGVTAANGNNKTVRLIIGATVPITSGAIALNNGQWSIKATYVRSAAAVQDSYGVYQNAAPTTVGPTRVAGTDDTTTALTVAVQASCPTAGADLTATGMKVTSIN